MLPTPPPPSDPLDQQRWNYSALVRRLIDGSWRQDADERHHAFFSDDTLTFLPPAELSRNPALSYWSQIAIAYDEAPAVSADGSRDGELSTLLPPETWPLAQQRHVYVVAANEALTRLDIRGGAVSYRVVPADLVTGIADPERPGQFIYLEETRPRQRIDDEGHTVQEWTVEAWDLRGAPSFTIFGFDEEGQRVDRTALYWHDEAGAPGGYPYIEAGPMVPYVLHHRTVGHHLWQPYRGRELVEGTLTASALWTMWVMGVRDGAHPQRYTIDLEAGGRQTAKNSDGQAGAGFVQLNPQTVLPFHSRKDRPGSAGQWEPTMDPKTAGEAIESFEAGLAQYAGLSGADVERGSSGQSGYAIVVKREGLRKVQARLEPALLMGDRLMLAKAAQLANAYLEGSFPTEPAAYSVRYAPITESPEEAKAAMEVIDAELAAGLIDEVDAYMRRNPGTSRQQAVAKLLDVRKTRALLGAATEPTAPADEPGDDVPSDEPDAPATAPEPAVEAPPPEPAANTALNGAQVQAAQGIVESVATGQLPRDTAVSMLIEFFNIEPDRAERIMGSVGKTFKPAPPPTDEPSTTPAGAPATTPENQP